MLRAKRLTDHALIQKKLDKVFNGSVVLGKTSRDRWSTRYSWNRVYKGDQLLFQGRTKVDTEAFTKGLIEGALTERFDK